MSLWINVLDFFAFGFSSGCFVKEVVLNNRYHFVRRKKDKEEDEILRKRVQDLNNEKFEFEREAYEKTPAE
jgi:hypothetical protein